MPYIYCTLVYHYMRHLHTISLLCLLLTGCYPAFAQDSGQLAVTDSVGVTQASFPKTFLDPDSTIAYCDSVIKASITRHKFDVVFYAWISKSIKYYEKEDYVKERECCMEALKWAAKSSVKDATAWCYNNIGDAYFSEGDYIQASAYYYKSLDELKKLTGPPTHITANNYNYLGLVNIRLGQTKKGVAYIRQAENISRVWRLDYQLGNALTYLGEYYNSVNEPDSAIKCFNEVMQIGRKMKKLDLQAQANDDLGKALIVKGEYHKAIPLLRAAISMSEGSYPYLVADASYSLGDALCHAGKYGEAENILLSALKEAKAHNYKDNYINCYAKLTDVYKATGNYKKALEYTDSLMNLKESLAGTEKAHAINQMEIKYKTAEKDKQLVQSQLLIEEQKNKIAHKNIWLVTIAGSVFLLSGILAGIYRNNRHKQRLQAEQIKSLQHENTISILKGMVQGEENERGRIARELHDGIGGMLSASMMHLGSMRHDDEKIMQSAAYNEAMKMLGEMGEEIRKTAHNLMPEVLLKQPLVDAIRTYCNHIKQSNALKVDFQAYGSFDDIAINNKLNIYRIVQELLKNIIQHAHATNVLAQLLINEHLLTITIEDDGIGFDTQTVKKGIGLHNLETRISSMNGHFITESAPGKGTSIYIEFELRKLTTA